VNGVDLNRDWVAFHQPETRAVRDEVRRIMAQPGAELWLGVDFHSTHYDVFYTLERTLETRPAGITDRWLAYITEALPHYEVRDAPSGLTTPMSRNWFYREFGAPALIYEVGDTTDRSLIREVAVTAARGTMQVLLNELRRGAAAR
jgi:cytosolic carboxypeptidase protein 6